MRRLLPLIALVVCSCATHSMTFHNGPKTRTVTAVHENPMHLTLFDGMLEPNSVELDQECGADDWVRIDQDDSFVNRYVAEETDGTVTPKSITIHCGPPLAEATYAHEGAPGSR